ncbi:hypothetical protein K0M31_006841 [Melipona bicolor]|uniref:Uncharacterized protein n=1 Tax=Melipona bicolor TaxID=60889 RepID=A0AA40FSD5_9HYME|nr:hypothetical protein K0M31_006841 [Melipona bicolor]
MISQEARERDDAGGILATSNSKRENGDVDYDYSDLAPETDVDAIDDVTTIPVKNLPNAFYKDNETEACNDEDQQFDKVSNVLNHGHIKESTDSNLSVPDATSQTIADSNLRACNEDSDPYSDNGTSSVGARNEIEKITFDKANDPMVSKHAIIESVISHFIPPIVVSILQYPRSGCRHVGENLLVFKCP